MPDREFRRPARSALAAAAVLCLALLAAAPPARAYQAVCVNDSTSTQLIASWPCASYYDVVTTRYVDNGTPVTVAYMRHDPPTTSKGLVVLLAGGTGQTGLQGNTSTHQATGSGNNFLVRSATLFAAQGFTALTIDAPSSTAGFTNAQYDQYRLSPAHAQDLVAVINAAQIANNNSNLDVFLAGTSRGVLSAVAQFGLGIGSYLSSPVTANGPNDDTAMLYLGKTGVTRLAPGFMHNIPAEVLYNTKDQCSESPPSGSIAWGDQLAVNIPTTVDSVTGGMQTSSACEALSYHGFYGIENAAVSPIATAMTDALQALAVAFPNRLRPTLTPPPALPQTSVQTNAQTPVCVNLAGYVTSPSDTSNLSFSLPFKRSSRGADLSIHGSTVTYTPKPSATNLRDGFVYIVSDGQHGNAAGIVSVGVNPNATGGGCGA